MIVLQMVVLSRRIREKRVTFEAFVLDREPLARLSLPVYRRWT